MLKKLNIAIKFCLDSIDSKNGKKLWGQKLVKYIKSIQ